MLKYWITLVVVQQRERSVNLGSVSPYLLPSSKGETSIFVIKNHITSIHKIIL
jgi:hypothetical protein